MNVNKMYCCVPVNCIVVHTHTHVCVLTVYIYMYLHITYIFAAYLWWIKPILVDWLRGLPHSVFPIYLFVYAYEFWDALEAMLDIIKRDIKQEWTLVQHMSDDHFSIWIDFKQTQSWMLEISITSFSWSIVNVSGV